ncbi:MAG: leucine-rich repeat domain-containing protein [Candidatus Methanomethylophilaceae archaeon]|nr:leucine-rich repeat domain-containing protein [Candidatus Methanomethylophilaceae archaeon]
MNPEILDNPLNQLSKKLNKGQTATLDGIKIIKKYGKLYFRGFEENAEHAILYKGLNSDHQLAPDNGSNSLKHVEIKPDVDSIPSFLFRNCKQLSDIHLPESLKIIGECSFSGCSSLKTIKLPKDLTTIGDYAFSNCSELGSVELPETTTHIGDGTFLNCSNLKNVTIHSTIETIGNHTFSNCDKLEEIHAPSVRQIGDRTFSGCKSLSNLDIHKEPLNFGYKTFEDCDALIRINDHFSTVGQVLFYDKIAIGLIDENTEILKFTNDQPISISKNSFMDNVQLKVIDIPPNVIEIGDNAFKGCVNVKAIILRGVPKIGSNSFSLSNILTRAECQLYSTERLPILPQYKDMHTSIFNKVDKKLRDSRYTPDLNLPVDKSIVYERCINNETRCPVCGNTLKLLPGKNNGWFKTCSNHYCNYTTNSIKIFKK